MIINDYSELNIKIEKTNTGYSAFFEEIGVFTTGKDVPETLQNLKEAFELYEEELRSES